MRNLREFVSPAEWLRETAEGYEPPTTQSDHRAVCKNVAETDTVPPLTYWCTRPSGHDGKHMAHGRRVEGYPVLAVWEA